MKTKKRKPKTAQAESKARIIQLNVPMFNVDGVRTGRMDGKTGRLVKR